MNPTEYRIFYIDDEKIHSDSFIRNLSDDFTIETVDFNGITLDSLITTLDERNFDYLVVDYTLNEMSGCGFDGDDILIDFTKKFPHFPVMLLTSFDDRAITNIEGFDPEKIHNKNEYTDERFKEAFIKRIKAKIDEYKSQNREAEDRIVEILGKSSADEELTAEEESDLIRFDTFLDESLSGDLPKIPAEMKEMTNTKRLETLLSKTDDLIERLKKYETVQG